MKNSLKEYIKKIDKIIDDRRKSEDIKKVLAEHVVKIEIYQHERLIHLIVTVTFAIITMIVFLYSISHFSLQIFFLLGLFILLLVPYIFHYYFLENNVQKLYLQYDKLRKKIEE